MTATQEFVVPKSIPITFGTVASYLLCFQLKNFQAVIRLLVATTGGKIHVVQAKNPAHPPASPPLLTIDFT
jgi:hypothetical protein